MDWMEVIAFLTNTGLVMIVVQYLKNFGMGWLKANAPWSLPIIAMFAAQLFGAAGAYLSGLLGYPIDFSAIVAVLTGSLAVVAFDVKHAASKFKARGGYVS